ncbi:MAG: CBS domain-containing protein [Desulfobacteraceae bacterium]|nr:CBS domain-containing protein [Desulfobacteraceae bacterium]
MLQVKDIMTNDVFALHAEQTLAMVRSLMDSKHIRHVPIVDTDNGFVGLLTHRDLLACTVSMLADIGKEEQDNLDSSISIGNVMRTKVATVNPDTDLREAINVLLENKYSCLPVLSNEKLVGIITEADFLKLTLALLRNTD